MSVFNHLYKQIVCNNNKTSYRIKVAITKSHKDTGLFSFSGEKRGTEGKAS